MIATAKTIARLTRGNDPMQEKVVRRLYALEETVLEALATHEDCACHFCEDAAALLYQVKAFQGVIESNLIPFRCNRAG